MGSIHGQSGSDRLRTVWTPEMDRYFIDLMLEQVGKGNGADDHLFSKRAWKYMTLLFNAKFKFQYEKDVLKNRHKTLRNLYRAVRRLLDQKGFSWDETRLMVTADNKVWDDYIKEHPDARSYRIKTIPYYDDLCLIYKSSTVEGNPSLAGQTGGGLKGSKSPTSTFDDDNLLELSSDVGSETKAADPFHEIKIDEDYWISMSNSSEFVTPQPEIDTDSRISARSRTYWQPPMDRHFIDLMLEQARKGNQIDGMFRKRAWTEMIASFNARFGSKYDIDILKNRYKTLRRQYNVVKNLLNLDGFSWDETRQMVTADDCVWQDYIKAHTDARQYMTRPMPYYKDLCVICKELNDDARDCVPRHNLDQQNQDTEVNFVRSAIVLQSPSTSVSSEESQKSKRNLEKFPYSTASKKARGREEGMVVMADGESNSVSVENVIEAIQALPDMDEDLILDACDFLEDEKKAKTFLALDVKLRKKWLLRKLRSQQQQSF